MRTPISRVRRATVREHAVDADRGEEESERREAAQHEHREAAIAERSIANAVTGSIVVSTFESMRRNRDRATGERRGIERRAKQPRTPKYARRGVDDYGTKCCARGGLERSRCARRRRHQRRSSARRDGIHGRARAAACRLDSDGEETSSPSPSLISVTCCDVNRRRRDHASVHERDAHRSEIVGTTMR